ncbi:hypothetical protein QNI19_35445 [Cytophagaceae bacterium DM2B3-1]|uniref:Uncharacterized protein n=1 Tax=Xanthocytophaga flava TaxID=3048013 RepID=A0ABT7CWY8_9BACT|nr:hypothetical protein [Xanthocytophaga flavus]MDJ1498285.1 hypothetical protein [Xanthocytophaga flavus]
MSNPSKRTLTRKPIMRQEINLHALLDTEPGVAEPGVAEQSGQTQVSGTVESTQSDSSQASTLVKDAKLVTGVESVTQAELITQAQLVRNSQPVEPEQSESKPVEQSMIAVTKIEREGRGEQPEKVIPEESVTSQLSQSPDSGESTKEKMEKETASTGKVHTDNEYSEGEEYYTNEEYNAYEKGSKVLNTSKLSQKNRKAKRKKEESPRVKFTTTLQAKYLEMIDEVSLQERYRDKNEWLEKILSLYAKKIGYDLG